MRIGSLCTGIGGLDLAADSLGSLAWVAEIDPAPSRVLAAHWPHVPNHGDLKGIDWTGVEPIDVLTAGYPCQPFSHAGRRKGQDDPRHLWPHIATGISAMRPALVLLENVLGHVTLGLREVLHDLATLGYDARWTVVAASDVGACHQRRRVFILAVDQARGGWPAPSTWRLATAGADGWETAGGMFPWPWTDPLPHAGSLHAGSLHAGSLPPRLLKTPTAQLAINGGSQHPAKRRSGGHGPTLADEVEHLLPSPTASISSDGITAERAAEREWGNLVETILLLPSPSAADGMGGHATRSGDRSDELLLPGLAKAYAAGALLPTPKASDGVKGGPRQRGSEGDLTLPSAACALLPTPTPTMMRNEAEPVEEWEARRERAKAEACNGNGFGEPLTKAVQRLDRWGRYSEAIARHEALSGRTAPEPTQPGSKGQPVLAPAFVEWMCCYPEGWVTDPTLALTRNEQLAALGNCVVPAQAAHAIALLVGGLTLTTREAQAS